MLFRIRAVIVDEVNIITFQEKKRKRKTPFGSIQAIYREIP